MSASGKFSKGRDQGSGESVVACVEWCHVFGGKGGRLLSQTRPALATVKLSRRWAPVIFRSLASLDTPPCRTMEPCVENGAPVRELRGDIGGAGTRLSDPYSLIPTPCRY